MITRREYMANPSELHNDYYSQFLTESIMNYVSKRYSIPFICANYEENHNWIQDLDVDTDVALIVKCDDGKTFKPLFEKVGDHISLGGMVCLYKYALRIIQKTILDAIEYHTIKL